jgi:hypothetical protein
VIRHLQLVTISWVASAPNTAMGDAIASNNGEWIRVSPFSWLIWTTNPSVQVANSFKEFLKPEDIVIAMYVDPRQAAGSAPQWVWDWINAKAKMHKSL